MKKVLVTGSSGFIGFHVVKKILDKKISVVGVDNHNNYYSPRIKRFRLKILKDNKKFKFYKLDISNKKKLIKLFKKERPNAVIHLAAQAGVRYSFENPGSYISSNIMGTHNILECMVECKIQKLIFASSSSVYGNQKKLPITEKNPTNPLNFYGLTKLTNEKQIKLFNKNYNIDYIILRFFTAYGQIGRPDMFIPKLKKNILKQIKVDLFNNGKHKRDFTFVEDISNIIELLLRKKRFKEKFRILNVCSGIKTDIRKVVSLVENYLQKKAKLVPKGIQRGDMLDTHGSNKNLKKYLNYIKFKNINYGIRQIFSDKYKKI